MSRPSPGPLTSVLAHVAMLALLIGVSRFAPRPANARMPGTSEGKRLSLTYSLGGAPAAAATRTSQTVAEAPKPVAAVPATAKPAVARAIDQGSGSSGVSALGSGNINIASVKEHPRPQPDLSALPRGAGGQVIMDAVIDETGKISELTLLQGLGGAIDDTVLATVRGWTFNPATRDGKPIASEQEILLYYERG